MFINFSNHPSKAWGKAQLNAAMEYGEVIDIPFPAVNPYSNKEEIYKMSTNNILQSYDDYLKEIVLKEKKLSYIKR